MPPSPRLVGDSPRSTGSSAAQVREKRSQRQRLVQWLEANTVLRGRAISAMKEVKSAVSVSEACRGIPPPATPSAEREWAEVVRLQSRLTQELRRCADRMSSCGRTNVGQLQGSLNEVDRKLAAAQRHHAVSTQQLEDEATALFSDLEVAYASVAAIATEAASQKLTRSVAVGSAARRSQSAPSVSTPRSRVAAAWAGRPTETAPLPSDDGWGPEDHATFERLHRESRGDEDRVVELAREQLPSFPEHRVREHCKWYARARSARERRRVEIEQWRSGREVQRQAAADVASRRERDEEEELRIRERQTKAESQRRTAEQQVIIADWHLRRAHDKEARREKAEDLMRQQSDRLRRERERRAKEKAMITAYRIQKEGDKAVRREVAEAALAAARAERAKGSQERVTKWLARDTEKLQRRRAVAEMNSASRQVKERDERREQYLLKAGRRSQSERCFDRLVQPTFASSNRERAVTEGEADELPGQVDNVLLRGVRVLAPAPVRLQGRAMSAWRKA